MRLSLAFIAVLTLGASPALAEPLLFEGFYVGMPRTQANLMRPETAWQLPTRDAASATTRKELKSNYLGQEAHVTISLDPAGQFVRLISFRFVSPSGSQCILDAVGIRFQLEQRYGKPLELTHEALGKRAKWVSDDGEIIRWVEACSVGTKEHFVTYANPISGQSLSQSTPVSEGLGGQ